MTTRPHGPSGPFAFQGYPSCLTRDVFLLRVALATAKVHLIATTKEGMQMPEDKPGPALTPLEIDLLQALREVVTILDLVFGPPPPDADGPAVRAHAAIRKALNKTH